MNYASFSGKELQVEEDIPHATLVYKIVGVLFEVYNELGHGMAEELYQERIELEFESRSRPFQAKPSLPCFYKGRKLRKHYEPDPLSANQS